MGGKAEANERTSEQANEGKDRRGKAGPGPRLRARCICQIGPAFIFRVRGMIGLLCSGEQSG